MAGISDYLENEILDHVLSAATYTPPATLYIALFTTSPNFETGAGGTEVTGGSYARLSVTNNSTNFPAASAGSKSNGATFTFTTPTASWGTVVGFGIYDDPTAGNLLMGNTLTTSKTINSGDTVSFNSGSITVTMD